jgi:glycosyltransferase involved in cell wall biosynthesis
MNITFVMDGGDNLSGGHRAIAMFAHGLGQLGHTVVLVARPPRPPSLRDRARVLLKGPGGMAAPKQRWSHFREMGLQLRILEDWRPIRDRDLPDADVIIATWWETVEWVHALTPSKGVKAHLMQDYEVWGGPVEEVNRSCRCPMPKIIAAEWVGELLQREFHQTPVALIPYGVDSRVFHAPPRGKQPVPTVGLTYTTMRNKGCDISLQAYRLARQTFTDLRLVGFGNMQPSLELPLPDVAHYHACASNQSLREIYSQCDAWLFGTRREGFGLPILEAMACRTPVIGTPAGAAPQLLRDGAGVLVRPEDPEDMAKAILQVCRLPDAEWRRMSTAAHAKASIHTWEKGTCAFESALRKLVESTDRHVRL